MRLRLLLLISILASAFPLAAQERQYAIRFGTSVNTGKSLVPAGTISWIVQPKSAARFRSVTTIAMRPIKDTGTSYAPQTGVEFVAFEHGPFEVFLTGAGGLATNSQDTSALVGLGPGFAWRPKFLGKDLAIVFSAPVSHADVQGGWRQQAGVSLQFEMR